MQLLSLMILLGLPGTATAVRHQEPHVHGEATLNVAREGSAVYIGLHMPGMTAVGFEHPAGDSSERKAVTDSSNYFKSGQWLVLEESAGCRLVADDVDAQGYVAEEPAASSSSDSQAAEHSTPHSQSEVGHDDDEDGHEHGHEHAEFHVALRYDCLSPLSMRSLDVRLFDHYPSLHKIKVAVVSESGQGSQVLTPGDEIIPLTILLSK